jgi:hypothetical protein
LFIVGKNIINRKSSQTSLSIGDLCIHTEGIFFFRAARPALSFRRFWNIRKTYFLINWQLGFGFC